MVTVLSWHGNRIRFTTTRIEIGAHRDRRFQVQPWNRVKKQRTKAKSEYFVTLDHIPRNTRQECVATALTICLFSGLHSFILRSDGEVLAGTNLCWRYACFSPTSEDLSQNIGPAIAGSARPGPPALSKRNECVKETVPLKLFKVQCSKAYGRSGAVQAALLPTAMCLYGGNTIKNGKFCNLQESALQISVASREIVDAEYIINSTFMYKEGKNYTTLD